MKKLLICFMVLMLITVLIFDGCADSNKTKLVLITDENGLDEYHSQQVYQTLKQLKKTYGYKLTVVTPKSAAVYSASFEEAVEGGADLIICSRPVLETELSISAKNNPSVNYVIIGSKVDINLDGTQDVPNVYSIMFSSAEEGFISGIYAALHNETGTVGFIGTDEFLSLISFEAAYKAGIKCISEGITVDVRYLNSSVSDEDLVSNVNEMAQAGCDVIYTINNRTPITETALQNKIKIIGSDYFYNDEISFLAEENIASGIELMCSEYFGGTFKGQIKTVGFADASCLVAKYLSEDDSAKQNVEEWIEQIKAGNINIPTTREGAQGFTSPVSE